MTTEQEKALKIVEKLISDMGCHTLSAEEIMVLIQGIMSNDCNSSYPTFTPGLYPNQTTSPSLTPPFRPGDVYCGDNPKISLYSTEDTTVLEELRANAQRFKGENEMIEEARQKLAIEGEWTFNQTNQPTFCAGDNIPNMQYVIR